MSAAPIETCIDNWHLHMRGVNTMGERNVQSSWRIVSSPPRSSPREERRPETVQQLVDGGIRDNDAAAAQHRETIRQKFRADQLQRRKHDEDTGGSDQAVGQTNKPPPHATRSDNWCYGTDGNGRSMRMRIYRRRDLVRQTWDGVLFTSQLVRRLEDVELLTVGPRNALTIRLADQTFSPDEPSVHHPEYLQLVAMARSASSD